MIRKAVIPAASLGTRLLPATMEEPKEMPPMTQKNTTLSLHPKPIGNLSSTHNSTHLVESFLYEQVP